MLKLVCSDCESLYHTKKGFKQTNPKLDDGEKIKITLQRYKCKTCDRKHSTTLKNLKKKSKNFLRVLKIKLGNRKRLEVVHLEK
ncbi:MAG: hypothetical protein LBC39_03835 [Methanobrevibacter sp.]|jgi:transposase-like protein|nr:hypothetical protein [Candidatus Methanovirga aequatorialis]